MMLNKIIKKWFSFKRPKLLVEVKPDQIWTPEWVVHKRDNDPFFDARKPLPSVLVLRVKDGWVEYQELWGIEYVGSTTMGAFLSDYRSIDGADKARELNGDAE